tara:strand:- start:394 stop:516 length:123 start_codon:yes stop_codon:yes gene_type:complete
VALNESGSLPSGVSEKTLKVMSILSILSILTPPVDLFYRD